MWTFNIFQKSRYAKDAAIMHNKSIQDDRAFCSSLLKYAFILFQDNINGKLTRQALFQIWYFLSTTLRPTYKLPNKRFNYRIETLKTTKAVGYTNKLKKVLFTSAGKPPFGGLRFGPIRLPIASDETVLSPAPVNGCSCPCAVSPLPWIPAHSDEWRQPD